MCIQVLTHCTGGTPSLCMFNITLNLIRENRKLRESYCTSRLSSADSSLSVPHSCWILQKYTTFGESDTHLLTLLKSSSNIATRCLMFSNSLLQSSCYLLCFCLIILPCLVYPLPFLDYRLCYFICFCCLVLPMILGLMEKSCQNSVIESQGT